MRKIGVVLLLLLFSLAVFALYPGKEKYEGLRVGKSKTGRGVFTKKAFAKGKIVEKCPLILRDSSVHDELGTYVFGFDDETDSIPLGYCALYNHSNDPNVEAEMDEEGMVVKMRALKNIKPGDQLLMKYEDGFFDERGEVEISH